MIPNNDYKHLILVDLENQIFDLNENDSFDIENILGYDEEKNLLYYSAHSPTASDLNIFVKNLNKISSSANKITTGEKTYASASFSPNCKYFALYMYGYDIPKTMMVSSSSYPNPLYILEDNEDFAEEIAKKTMPKRKYIEIESAEGNEKLNTVLYLPPGLDEKDSSKKYPLLLYVYGGPDSQTVNYEYELDFWYYHSFLASSMGVVIASIDNRGTCCKGQEFLKQTYKNLGDLEVEDQILAMETLSKLDYIDESRIGIWGWSYGGYMASRVISEGNSIVKGAISVAPVTDWRFYDNIYTERYMQTPDLNPVGYAESATLGRAKFILSDQKYLLIHGTGDDNVHFQNTADWVTDLVKSDVDFKTMFYPDKAHSLSGIETRTHLWKLITRFWADTFNLPVPSLDTESAESVTTKSKISKLERHNSLF